MAWDAITVLAAGLLILALASIPAGKAGWLGSKPAVYLGEISYSVYMVCAPWQILAVNLAARATGAEDKRLHVLVWMGIILGLIAAAAATYHLVERPARKALRGMAERRRPPVDHTAKQSETVLQPSDTIV
jgi:peptidoglycan/LPS O-acetylase OafA/YrhL